MRFKVNESPPYILIDDGLGLVQCLRTDLLELWEQLDELFHVDNDVDVVVRMPHKTIGTIEGVFVKADAGGN